MKKNEKCVVNQQQILTNYLKKVKKAFIKQITQIEMKNLTDYGLDQNEVESTETWSIFQLNNYLQQDSFQTKFLEVLRDENQKWDQEIIKTFITLAIKRNFTGYYNREIWNEENQIQSQEQFKNKKQAQLKQQLEEQSNNQFKSLELLKSYELDQSKQREEKQSQKGQNNEQPKQFCGIDVEKKLTKVKENEYQEAFKNQKQKQLEQEQIKNHSDEQSQNQFKNQELLKNQEEGEKQSKQNQNNIEQQQSYRINEDNDLIDENQSEDKELLKYQVQEQKQQAEEQSQQSYNSENSQQSIRMDEEMLSLLKKIIKVYGTVAKCELCNNSFYLRDGTQSDLQFFQQFWGHVNNQFHFKRLIEAYLFNKDLQSQQSSGSQKDPNYQLFRIKQQDYDRLQ